MRNAAYQRPCCHHPCGVGARLTLCNLSQLKKRPLLKQLVLWRGLKNMRITEDFLRHGGSELAPCSTSTDLQMAVRYAKDWRTGMLKRSEKALIFRVLVDGFMQQGPHLSFLSAFPHEKEALYPPLTFFKPVRKEAKKLTYNGTEFSIVDVKPTFPT